MITVGFTLHVDRSLTDRLLILSPSARLVGHKRAGGPTLLSHSSCFALPSRASPGPSREIEGAAGRATGPALHRAKV